jgi:hypothetical protein
LVMGLWRACFQCTLQWDVLCHILARPPSLRRLMLFVTLLVFFAGFVGYTVTWAQVAG